MARNLELKIELGSFGKTLELLKANEIQKSDVLNQKDTYYKWDKGLLKLRQVNGAFEFIKYNRDETGDDRWSDYYVLRIDDEKSEEFFADILKIEVIVKKKRELYIYKHTRIHLDEVESLGAFLELETVVTGDLDEAKKEFDEVVNMLELDLSMQIKKSYRNLLAGK